MSELPSSAAEPSEPTAEEALFSKEDSALLNETKQLRMTLIRSLAKDGQVPNDKSDKVMLTQLLNDVDGQIIAKSRTKIAAKTEQTMGNMAAVVAAALKKHRVGGDIPAGPRSVDLPSEFSAGTIVPGETDQGVKNITMDDLGI